MHVIIAPQARSDIMSILAWTQESFGPSAYKRYAQLLETAIAEIAEDPVRAGSVQRREIAENCRTYHLFHSRKKADTRGNRIRKPRHFLLYRVVATGVVEVGRVLHDSMDLEQHLPEEYRG
jgi:toxin ParE1/3/4